jgi:hypothetical protein
VSASILPAQCNLIAEVDPLGPGCLVAGTPTLAIAPGGACVVLSLSSVYPNAMAKLIVSLPGAPFVVQGCNVFLDPGSISVMLPFMTDAQGNYVALIPIPENPLLDGITLVVQATTWVSGAPVNDDYLTNGLAVTVRCASGSVGCTPGYWKQSHHFDSWPDTYDPDQLFSSVFENAFPGMTLLQVLETGGGGLEALGRHAVASLLNAEASGASFGLAPNQVVGMFNTLFPDFASEFESLKDIFEDMNEQGCNYN